MSLISRKPAAKILLISLCLAVSNVFAAQVLTGSPDDTLAARVARHEPTMIRVDGHKIIDIFGIDGDFEAKPDSSNSGTAFFNPLSDKSVLSAYVSDSAGRTWRLLLSVTDEPAETIVIKSNKQVKIKKAVQAGKDQARNQIIKRMVLGLAGSGPEAHNVRETLEAIPLWNEATFIQTGVIDGDIRGERYQLTNTSATTMRIDERELYRPGTLGIVVEKPELAPSESTMIYVVSEGRK